MPVAMLVDNPAGSKEIYEKARKQIGLDEPAGGVLHVAGPSPSGGWRVIEVFESEDEGMRFFKDRLGPALKAAGGLPDAPLRPQFWEVHNYMK